MTHEEYIAKQMKRVSELAHGMLDGSINYLEGAIEISSLRHEVEAQEIDPDFDIFVGIESEIGNLPIGSCRQHWSKEALDRHEPEIEKALKWARENSLNACKSLAERFGSNGSRWASNSSERSR
jgi:hypothetical protein